MSIILDALRRGRSKPAPGPNPNAAQTDAVLQTLGYGRLNPATPLNRLKRGVAVLALAAMAAVALWALVIWLTHAYMYSPTETNGAVVPQSGKPVAMQAQAPNPPAPAPSSISPPSSVAAPTDSGVPETTVVAPPPAVQPLLPGATPARSAPAARVAEPAADSSNRFVVQNSQRVSVPGSPPEIPAGAPSRSTASTAGANRPTVTTGDDHFGRALMYQRLGDFENALVSYRQVLQRDDLNVEAHNNLGVLYRDKGLFEDAIRHFQRAIAINPGYARARNNLGVVYLAQRKPDLSASQFHAALAIDPKNVESMVNLSTLEKESGQRDEARGWLTRALAIDPRNPEAHYNMGLLEDEDGSQTQAQDHYRAFLQYGAASHPSLVGDVRKRLESLAGK